MSTEEIKTYIAANWQSKTDYEIGREVGGVSDREIKNLRYNMGLIKHRMHTRANIAKMYELFLTGEHTLQNIGKMTGSSGETVRSLINKHFKGCPNSGFRYVLTLGSNV